MINKRGKIAISQIIILVIGIVAISYALGSEMRVVSADSTFEGFLNDVTTKKTKGSSSSTLPAKGISKGTDVSITLTGGTKASGTLAKTKEGYTITPSKGDPIFFSASEVKSVNVDGIWAGYGTGFVGNLAQGLWWSAMVIGMIQLAGSLFDIEDEKIDAASIAAFAGIMVGKGMIGAVQQWGNAAWLQQTGWWGLSKGTWLGGGFGIAAAAIAYYYFYEEKTTQTITFTCYPWEAPTKGDYCEECNNQELPCSEYQCRSLGQACELLNQGTDEEKCVWVNRNDVNPPVIKPLENALLDDYRYKLQNTGISPPAKGVIIEYIKSTDKCVPAFTPLSFGVTTDEPAKCKIDYIRKDSFDDMDFYFGGSSTSKYNHTQVMSLPGASAAETENLTIRNDGNFELYVKCQDANGNYNTADFVFKLCVDAGPDTTPPLISGTNPLNGLPIAYNQTSIDIEVYVNEPVECKWSHSDQSYDSMPDENKMDNTKADSVSDIDAQGRYTLTTTLTGLKDRQENKFYFRCKDQPSAEEEDRNVNAESYKFVLIGTQPLKIDSVGPSGIIKDSTEVVKVTLTAKTSAGYHEGEATCEFGETLDLEVDDKFTPFWTHEHSYDLWLTEGDYEYFIRCYDLGGNPDNKTVNFTVETDRQEPLVVRAYRDGTYLRIITNEPAECVYDNMDCSYSFDDGIDMKVIDETNHFTEWNTEKDFYIKCRDEYGNLPDECSIIIRPFEVYKGGE